MRFSVQPMLQLKFGKIAVRALAMFDYWTFKTRNATAYEPTLDTLLPDNGWTVSTDTDVLYVTDRGLADLISAGRRVVKLELELIRSIRGNARVLKFALINKRARLPECRDRKGGYKYR